MLLVQLQSSFSLCDHDWHILLMSGLLQVTLPREVGFNIIIK